MRLEGGKGERQPEQASPGDLREVTHIENSPGWIAAAQTLRLPMWLASVAVLLLAQSSHDHDHSAHGVVPDALQTRSDFISVAKAAGKVSHDTRA